MATVVGRTSGVSVESVPSASSVLVIAPHPDDETVGCGGTLALHRLMGDAVVVAFVTDGRRSEVAGATDEARVAARKREAEDAAAILRINDLVWLGHEEWSWDFDRVTADLRALIRNKKPTVVYAPCRIDGHPEHVRVARAAALAMDDWADIQVRSYQIHTPLTPLLVNRAFDVSPVHETALRALQAYRTQLSTIARTRRLKWYSARMHGAESEAEVFWEMTASQYKRIHYDVDEQEWQSFAGLGPHAFRDPAAYLVGLGVRVRTRAGLRRP